MTLSVEKAKELYDEHSNTQFFDDLVSFMTRCGLAIHTRCSIASASFYTCYRIAVPECRIAL
jgi:hypothetical protein